MARSSLLALTLSACASSALDVGPIPGTGYGDVRLDLAEQPVRAEDVTDVLVGGLRAYDLRRDGDLLTVKVQGGPPGAARVVLRTAEGDVDVGAVTYEGPVDPLFDRFVAYGASLTQGTRDAVPTMSSQLMSPAVQIARATGAWLPLPLLADPITPMAPSDVVDCTPPDTVQFILSEVLDALDRLVDPDTGETDLSLARVTPEVEPANVAVGNATMAFQRVGYGRRAQDAVAQMIGRLTLEASGADLFAELDRTPLQRVLQQDPTLLVSFDLWGNDAIYALFTGDGLRGMPPAEEIAAELDEHLALLEPTGAQVILAALPDVTVLPGRSLGPEEAVGVRERVAAYNRAAREAAATRSWLHVAPFDAVLDEIVAAGGLRVGDALLTTDALGGLLSLDGLHFTDTGYALAANVVLAVVRDELGVPVDDVDLEAVLAQDTRSPAALVAAGVDPACLPEAAR